MWGGFWECASTISITLSYDGALFYVFVVVFFFQAEDGIRDLVRSRGLGDVYKRQGQHREQQQDRAEDAEAGLRALRGRERVLHRLGTPVSYTHLTLPTIYPV